MCKNSWSMCETWPKIKRPVQSNPKPIRLKTRSKGLPWISTPCWLQPLYRRRDHETPGVGCCGHFSHIHGRILGLGISRRRSTVYLIAGHRGYLATISGLVCSTTPAACVGAAIYLRGLCRLCHRLGDDLEWTLVDRSSTAHQGCDQRLRANYSSMAKWHCV